MSIRRFMLTGVLLLAAGALGLRLAFFALSTARVPASSDEVLSILQAEKLMADGRPPLLVLANPYQFPVETYAHLPLVRLLPRTALGARLVPFLLSLAATALFLAALLRAAPRRDAWPFASTSTSNS